MSNEIVNMDELLEEFRAVAAQLDEVLKDLEWRKPDVEGEEKKLKALRKAALKDKGVDVASQAIVVRVGRSILNDKIKEAHALEKRMLQLKAQLEKAEEEAAPPGMVKVEEVKVEEVEVKEEEEEEEGGEKAEAKTGASEGV